MTTTSKRQSNGGSALRVLVTARDAGAACQNRAFVEDCLANSRRFEFELFLQQPATGIFRGCNVPSTEAALGLDASLVDSVFERLQPDFVLVGLSGFDTGVDEAILAYAKQHGVPSGAIQDYWGYIGGHGAHECPDVFFVLDDKARRLTLERIGRTAQIEITGSPKHEVYARQVGRWTRRGGGRADPSGRVVFFLQPRSVPGMLDNLVEFVSVLGDVDLPLSAAIKLHPSDSDGDFLAGLLEATRVAVQIIPADAPVEVELGRADIVATCCSTVGLDHNYMQAYADRSLGTVLYMTIGDPIKEFMRDVIGQDSVPGADVGMGTSFDSTLGLAGWIREAITDERERERYRRAVQENLSVQHSPSSRIADVIESYGSR